MKKNRNALLACVARNDPSRYRTRTVETEERKQVKNRARRKEIVRKELRESNG